MWWQSHQPALRLHPGQVQPRSRRVMARRIAACLLPPGEESEGIRSPAPQTAAPAAGEEANDAAGANDGGNGAEEPGDAAAGFELPAIGEAIIKRDRHGAERSRSTSKAACASRPSSRRRRASFMRP